MEHPTPNTTEKTITPSLSPIAINHNVGADKSSVYINQIKEPLGNLTVGIFGQDPLGAWRQDPFRLL